MARSGTRMGSVFTALVVVATAWVGAASSSATDGHASSRDSGGERVTVFAAASLTEAFRDAARAFGRDEGPAVVLNLAGSQTLAAQILAGAPADVFASADPVQMERVEEEGLLAGPPVPFAENGLAIVTERGNPHRVQGLEDLARPELSVVLAAPEVPVGRYARAALEEAAVEVRPVSLETDVKQVLAKVALGEADAGIVYRTDLRAAGTSVSGVEVAPASDQRARYRVGVLEGAGREEAARAFVAFLGSPEGRRILRSHGFVPAPEMPPAAESGGKVRVREP